MRITNEQYEALRQAHSWDRPEEFNKLLEETTGIKATPYTGYSYYDEAGNYIGDSNDITVIDLLDNAYIVVEG